MRQFCDSKGNVLWTRKLRLALGKSWGLTDRQVRDLSNEAHRRVCEEVDDPESHRRNVGSVMLDGLAHCKANKDWKTAAVVSTVILKMADGPVKIEVSVETKQPTPADAARAVREMFTDRVENDESKSDESGASSEGDPESADSPADEPTPE